MKVQCLIWPFRRQADTGYALWGGLKHRTRRVSRMVCEDVYGPPPFPEAEAAHNCGKGHLGCVAKTHLRWATPAGNQADRVLHGTDTRGENQWNHKLTTDEVLCIRGLASTLSQKEIADRFGVTRGTINKILTGKNWAWLE